MRSYLQKLRITQNKVTEYIYIHQRDIITTIITAGNYQKAEKLYRKLLKRARAKLGESHPKDRNTLITMNN